MTNADTPAESTGGNTATPSPNPLAELPPRIRVHALAKLLGATSKDLLAKLGELGESTRSAQSSVSREVALRAAEALGIGAPEASAPAQASEAKAEPAPQGAPATEPDGPRRAEPALPAPQPAVPAAATPVEPAAQPAPALPQAPVFAPPSPVFLPPEPVAGVKKKAPAAAAEPESTPAEADTQDGGEDEDEAGGRRRRRRGRRGRGRGKGGDEVPGKDTSADEDSDSEQDTETDTGAGKRAAGDEDTEDQQDETGEADTDSDESASRRRRRRRRRKGGDGDSATSEDDPPNTVVHVREPSRAEAARDQVRSVRGSTRLEAKRQRRRDGREAGRRRAPILSEAEFLARREAVERTMVVRESPGKGKNAVKDRTTQIGVLEDGVLVEHFVTSSGSGSIVGNVYLGRVQNVLPSMEAAFVDIGRGRNAVLYAGEVDWDAAGLEGKSRKIEQALSTGDSVLVQVTKDPVGHKGARLTTQISLPGRYLVYVPGGGATGISRKLPENERRRLKDILKRIVPEDAGVIIRTASEGIIESELERDVRRLRAQWDIIKEKSGDGSGSKSKKSGAPTLLYEEPDLLVKVVRDLFTEDFTKLVVQGALAWETISSYVEHVAPDLADRLEPYVGTGDVFADYRIDEQITKALDRKVWLPSGGYLVIDRTEAMTVIDVNTGKFTGSGGNLEETVTRNNLEAAEEIVRQLRLRDIGGIIVIDFIDMVLESNRDLVLRRLTECLGRDRTRHQVAEVTSLGLVQMTRKRVGTGLIEAFSTACEHCKGRGVVVSTEPQPGSAGAGFAVSDGGPARKRGKGKGDEGREAVPVVPETTPEQRESIVSAVQAMANASKAAAAKEHPAGARDEGAEEPAVAATATSANGHVKHAEEAPVTEASPEAPAPPAGAVPAAEVGSAAEAPPAEPTPAEATPSDAPEEAQAAQEPAASAEAAEVSAAPQGSSAVVSEPVTPPAETNAPVEEPAVPAAAQVPQPAVRTVTRRSRRAASRPAGPPVGASLSTAPEPSESQE